MLRVIDERNTRAASLYPEAVKSRPFAVQEKINNKWCSIPGATYATKPEATAAKEKIRKALKKQIKQQKNQAKLKKKTGE